jgi:hypothetical protein
MDLIKAIESVIDARVTMDRKEHDSACRLEVKQAAKEHAGQASVNLAEALRNYQRKVMEKAAENINNALEW